MFVMIFIFHLLGMNFVQHSVQKVSNPCQSSFSECLLKKKTVKVYVSAFSRRFYPKRLTNEDITAIKKLTISYIEGTHSSDSVRGDGVDIECRHRGKYRIGEAL